jgi:hypothetical protein
MKQIIVFFLAFISSLSAYCQVNNLEEGNQCFNQGNYSCAEAKYKEAFKTAEGKDKQIAEIKLQRTKRCIENLKNADLAYNSKNYSKAKEYYSAILESNSNDEFVKGRLESINVFLTPPVKKPVKPSTQLASNPTKLSLSKTEISFKSSGGSNYIDINSNLNLYTIDMLPSWYSVQKYDNYFVVICNVNTQNSSRYDYFNVKVGSQTIRVNVKQEGSSYVSENKLEASKENLYFSYDSGNVETVYITTNAIDFYTSLVPSWFYVTKYKSYITVSCQKNDTGEMRTDWFKVDVDKKEIKIYVTQSANPKSTPKPPNGRGYNSLGSFSSFGLQSGEIAKYGLIYEHGGRKTVGFRFSARTSLTSEQDILNGIATKNKTEIELGPNFRVCDYFYLNLGIGYGYYDRIMNNDYVGEVSIEKTGYSVATTGLMIRLLRVININGGVSFMDIDKDIYKPEITFGISFNLRGKNKY